MSNDYFYLKCQEIEKKENCNFDESEDINRKKSITSKYAITIYKNTEELIDHYSDSIKNNYYKSIVNKSQNYH